MNHKLNPQAENIYQILLDMNWHCPIDWKYSDGHGKRLTDINRYLLPKGQKLDWKWCDCGRHTSQIKARRIIGNLTSTHDLLPNVQEFLRKFPSQTAEISKQKTTSEVAAKQPSTLF